MLYTALDNFYLTDAELENSPSRQQGVSKEAEATNRVFGCELIQEAGILLKCPQAVMATGQVIFQRFFCKKSMREYNIRVSGGGGGDGGVWRRGLRLLLPQCARAAHGRCSPPAYGLLAGAEPPPEHGAGGAVRLRPHAPRRPALRSPPPLHCCCLHSAWRARASSSPPSWRRARGGHGTSSWCLTAS